MNFLELVKARYSVRNYEERPIEQNKLDYIMECVRLAPSAVNFQPWKFAVITEKKLLEALKSAYPREWIKTAPCIIVACGDHNVAWHRKLDNKDHTDVDVSIAVEHLCLAAAEQGLGTCWVCNFDVPLCKEILGLPANIEPVALVPVGYPASQEVPERRTASLYRIFYSDKFTLFNSGYLRNVI